MGCRIRTRAELMQMGQPKMRTCKGLLACLLGLFYTPGCTAQLGSYIYELCEIKFSTQMIKQVFASIILIIVSVSVRAQTIQFKDTSLKKAILNYVPVIDLNRDSIIQLEEAEKVEVLNLMGKDIKGLVDISNFKNLKKLILTGNTIDSLSIDGLHQLEALYCAKASLRKVSLSNLPKLSDLALGMNNLTEIELKELPNLTSLNLMDNNLTAVNVSAFGKLKYLTISNNKISQLDISNNIELIQIIADNNRLSNLDITKSPNLKVDILYIDDSVKLTGTEEQLKVNTAKPIITRQ